ncbi:hypothetical protein [Asaia sp. As-1742]|uniref:hypothetical protein n=1 Tax=Asaia sp. As-1742 TaxID=2608325 RepID=UPI0014230E49|nr:hypothetical protein [Asaia sp. As-1742]NIE79242.1 hypothetical protein [Asaia sp. As-1742]
MAGALLVARGLALCCAARFALVAEPSTGLTQGRVIFRAGALMPSDLFASPSLREAVSYVTVTLVSGRYERLPVPLGNVWAESFYLPPDVILNVQGRVATIARIAGRTAPGVVSLRWSRDDGSDISARYVAQDRDSAQDIVQALAAEMTGCDVEAGTLRVSSGALEGAVSGYARSTRLTRRQSQLFRVSIWTDSECTCEALGRLLTERLLPDDWLALPDGTTAQLVFEGEEDRDAMQTQNLFRRDVLLRAIWDDHASVWSPRMLAGGGWMQAGGTQFPFDVPPDLSRGETPVGSLDALAALEDMPIAYRGWRLRPDGTVIETSSFDGCG